MTALIQLNLDILNHLLISSRFTSFQKDETLDESALGASLNESQDQVSADEALRADTARREIGEKLQALSEQLNSHEQYAKSLQQNDETFSILRVSET